MTDRRRLPPLQFTTVEVLLRLLIGGAFIYAGWLKAQDPVGFADGVATFAILPNRVISAFALALPMFEIGGGALLIAGWPRRLGALALLVLTGIFCIALAAALARGLQVNCGCFGPSASTTNPWVDLIRDLLTVAACALLYDSDGLRRRLCRPVNGLLAA